MIPGRQRVGGALLGQCRTRSDVSPGAPRCAPPPCRPAGRRARARCPPGSTSRAIASSSPRGRRSEARRDHDLAPQLGARRHGVDPQQAHAAQDEGEHRRGQRRAGGEAAEGNGAAVARRAQGVGGGGASDGVDRRRPARLLQRAVGVGGRLLARDDLVRAEAAQVVGLVGLARRGPHLVAGGGQRSDGGAADAAAGAEHEHRPVIGAQAVGLERVDREAGREPGRAERHRLARRQAVGQRHDPGRGHARVLRPAAVVRDAEVVAGDQHLARRPPPPGRRRRRPRRRGRRRARAARCARPGPWGSSPARPCS